MSGERSTRMKGDGSREGLEFRVIGFEYNRGIERSRIRNASTILRAVVIRVHWSGQMQGGECVKCSLIWVKWGRVHRVAGMVCNAARERGYTVLERGRGIFGLDGDGRRKWGRKVCGEREGIPYFMNTPPFTPLITSYTGWSSAVVQATAVFLMRISLFDIGWFYLFVGKWSFSRYFSLRFILFF